VHAGAVVVMCSLLTTGCGGDGPAPTPHLADDKLRTRLTQREKVAAASTDALPRTTELKQALRSVGSQLLGRAHDAGVVRADLTSADLVPLMCGVAFAATVHGGPDSRVETARRYLTSLLEGLYVH
jgi:hypothetical protein